MRNESADMRISQIGSIMQRIKENGTRSEQGLKTQVTRRMLPHLRSSMHLAEDRDFDIGVE